MHRLETYPLDHPKKKRMSINSRSELIIGMWCTAAGPRWMLHMRKMGIKSVLAKDNAKRRLADQMRNIGNEQTYLLSLIHI